MIEIYRDIELAKVGHFQSILESEGIKTFMRNQSLSSSEVAIPTFYPALCVMNEEDVERAVTIIRSYLQPQADENTTASTQEIPCPNCKEMNPGNFAQCWSCDTAI